MKRVFIRFCLMMISFITCYPIVFMLIGSLMDTSELNSCLEPIFFGADGYVKFPVLPRNLSLWKYIEVLFDTPEFFITFWNSMKIASFTLIGQMVFGVTAAWGFARYRFPFRKILFRIYILFMLLPFQVIMLSEYIILDKLQMIDTLWAVIVPGIFSTFSVFILYYFFVQIPEDIVEAARLDGASEWKIFIKIGIPLGYRGIMAMLVLNFLECWNLVEQPITFLKQPRIWPLSIYFVEITGENAGQVFSSAVLAFIPSLFIFVLGQDYLESGIVASTPVQRKR